MFPQMPRQHTGVDSEDARDFKFIQPVGEGPHRVPVAGVEVLDPGGQFGEVEGTADEVAAAQETLARLVSGLLRRCRERVYLGLSELGETGFEQRGVMLKAFQKVLAERKDEG